MHSNPSVTVERRHSAEGIIVIVRDAQTREKLSEITIGTAAITSYIAEYAERRDAVAYDDAVTRALARTAPTPTSAPAFRFYQAI